MIKLKLFFKTAEGVTTNKKWGYIMKDAERISLVIFDMDGLMFDTERIAVDAWKYAGSVSGVDIPDKIIESIVGVNVRKSEEIFKKYYGENFPFYDVRKLKIDYSTNLIQKQGIPIKKGLLELLEFLKDKNILRAVATSTERERTLFYLSNGGLTDKFNIIVCGDEVIKSKPEPDIFLTAANKLGVDPGECIVLEDSQNGLLAASRAGMYPIFIPDIRRPSLEVMNLIYKEFESLDKVKSLF